ncbi:DnaB-like helicase C-terminal domain-containing protein [Streptomyces spongiae]|uniref:AAA family ATPase n=1 Tax=Streptomyces spongiae TaxID=565072 RepID=A0A5N8XNR8_9ACTN|nr:DnaB-like helicase C-terminal domain-containing protein [Streptomyces spongiae]MPY60957.1 AAA family ATPase [Streptomyces spongiae]
MSDRPVVPEPSDVVESVAESAAGPAAVEPAGPVAGPAAVVVLGVTEARNRLYQLVDAARGDGQVVVVEKRDAKARHTYRAALIPVARLDAGSRARLSGWPSWARTAARPKLGDLVVEAGDSPVRRGVPQVLLERTTPLAVLVEASLVPPGDVLVAVPGEALTDAGVADAAQLPSAAPGAAEGPAAPVVGPGTALAAPGAAEDPSPVRAAAAPGHAPAPALDDATAVPAAAVPGSGAVSVPEPPAAAAGGGDPQGAGRRAADQAAGEAGQTADRSSVAAAQEAVGGQAAVRMAASARTAEVPPPVPAAAGGGLHRLHGLGEVAGLALTEAVAPPAVPRFGFGLHALDAVLGSLPSGVLTVVAAEPHGGGSLLAVHAARHTALTRQLPVLYAASGLSRTAVALRVIAAEAGLDYRRLRTGSLTEDEQQAAAQVQARLTAADLHVDDGTGLTAEAIAETVPYVEGLALVVVDRFQHAADPFIPLSGPALPEAARVLAHLARTRNVPVVAVLDTADPDVLAALDAAHLTLTLTRTGNDAQVAVAERDFGELTRVPLRADLACARFTDPPEPVRRFDAARAFRGAEGEKVTADLADAVRPYMEAGALEQLPDDLRGVLAALVHHLDEEQAGDEWTVSELSSSQRAVCAAAARRPRLPDTDPGRRLQQALQAFYAYATTHGYRPSAASHAPVPDEVLPAAPDATSAGPVQPSADPGPGMPPGTTADPAATTSPSTAAGATPAAPGVALQPGPAPAVSAAAGERFAAAEAELLDAALPFTSGARHGLSARLTGALSAMREASTVPGRADELPGLRQALAGLATRRTPVPPTLEGERLGAALAAFTAAHHDTPTTVPSAPPAAATSAGPPPAPAQTPEAGPTLTQAPDLATAEAELLAAAAPFLTGNERSELSVHGQHVLTALRDALAPGNDHLLPVLPAARARAAELGARRLRLPATIEADRLRTALTAYHAAATAAGITPSALPAPGPAGVTGPVRPVTPAPVPPTASLTVTEPAPAGGPVSGSTAAAEASGAAPGAAGDARAADPARRVLEGVVMEAPSASFSDDTPPPEGTPGTGTGSGSGRNYSFFLNKISAAVEQALDETDGDIEAAVKMLQKKAVPDSMALFKLTRVGGNYVHTVYPPALDFLSKPGQCEADGVWEGRQKWRNAPLYEAIKRGERHPLDVFGLDINAAYLSAFKTHLPIGALKHDPTGGFDKRKAGIHRVDQFDWPHTDLPSPLGNRIEPGPYLLDEATVRLLIRCSELGLSEPPRILESWTSGASEALLEKFRRILQQARQTALETEDPVTGEYVKAMYSRFTSTIGESGKNRELRRPEWVHTIRSQAFASLWLKAWKAHQAGLILVQVSGVDELHVAGGDWKKVWEEGRNPTQMKEKRFYTLGGK